MNEIKLLTPKDVQELFGIGKNNAYTLMHTPGFPSIIIGKRIYVEQEQLRNWLNTYSGRSFLI